MRGRKRFVLTLSTAFNYLRHLSDANKDAGNAKTSSQK